MEFRSRLVENYDELFGQSTGGGLDGISQFGKKWSWYQSIYALAQGDVTRFDTVTKYRLTKCLNYLSFEKQKQEIEQRQLNKQLKR